MRGAEQGRDEVRDAARDAGQDAGQGRAARADGRLARAAVVLAVLGTAATAATVWLDVLVGAGPAGPRLPAPLDWPHWGSALAGWPLMVAGGVLGTRLPRHPMTWLLLAGGAVAVADGAGAAYAGLSLLHHGGGLPLTSAAVFVGARFGPAINLLVPVTLLFFPDGGLPSRRWRWPVRCAVGAQALGVVLALMMPWWEFSLHERLSPALRGLSLDPLSPPLPPGFWQVAMPLCRDSFFAAFAVAVAAFAVRFRRAGEVRRAQLRWMLLAVLVDIAIVGGSSALTVAGPDWALWWVGDIAFALMHAVVAAAVVVAVARHRLYDVDLLLGWTLLYGAVAVAVIAVDTAVFVGAGRVFDDPVAAVLAAGVVAVLYGPLRLRLQRWVTRLVTGRGDPYDVVSALARRLEDSRGPDELLAEVARVVAVSFRSPYVRVELERSGGGAVVVEHGRRRADAVVLPFAYRGVRIGTLALVARAGARLSEADQRLLADMIRQAAAAARATALAVDLQASREQLVSGIAEERRRLRRDLHDGLGPSLAAAALKIEAARALASRDAGAADATLADVRGDLSVVLGDVRRLVHDLRPPSLDQFGLAGAVEQLAGRFRSRALSVAVECGEGLGVLPAAVEEAAYRIVGEALHNVARHAGASGCAVRLAAGARELRVEVADDGHGVPPGVVAGVGLVGMRERAEELGGRCEVAARPEGGTRVLATLPYGPAGRAAGTGARVGAGAGAGSGGRGRAVEGSGV
ncbi:sensor histidine kinase [Actinomadura parmotrematis]|uniref:histidine kinase n=1 Tax=Actinomadura parmotrematis TaxID=2864039 RepID=A0ABS7FSM9_9ACTN|nr:histidine kinase [Actinomadura parmotrematis]MBW8482739.1 sensor histidine kinase [Actinomadura parmotrematis]